LTYDAGSIEIMVEKDE